MTSFPFPSPLTKRPWGADSSAPSRGFPMTILSTTRADSPLARAPSLPRVDDLVASFRPTEPLICLRPATLVNAAREFVAAFPGQTMYAVKCNPDATVLRALWDGGVRHFD